MKKKIILSILLLFGVCCAGAAGETQGMYVRDRAFNLNARLKNPPKLEDPNSFSIIVFGDPQSYSKFDFNQAVFELMTSWAAVQKNNLNVMTVLCTGDLVEQNGILDSTAGKRYKRCNGNTPSDLQWESVSHAFKRLDGVYPYVLCTGNHDYGIEASENRNSRFPEIFNISRNNAQWGKHLVRTAPNAFGVNTLENAAYEFSDKNWGKILILSLEFSPRDEIIEWAKKLCSEERFADYKVFVLTHSILNKNGSIRDRDSYPAAKNTGKDLVDRLLAQCPNIKFAVCGHTGDSKTMSAFHTAKKADGKNLPIMMFNPQAISGWYGNGGDGWLRILEFKPDGKTISVRTYSPLFAFSQRTENLAWEESPKHKFEFQID